MGNGRTIRAHDLPGLIEYGTVVSNFASQIEWAAEDTSRSFNVRVEGSKADAINKFFEKLNLLQNQLFIQVPESIKQYGQTVSEFSTDIQGVGFSQKCYTSSDIIDNVCKILQGDQLSETERAKTDLEVLLKEAAASMGKSEDFGTFKHYTPKAQAFIEEEKNARTETHSKVVSAEDNALKKVADHQKVFESLEGAINHAKAFANVPVSEVIESIKYGGLTKDNMYILDAVQNSEDVEIARTLISEGKYKANKDLRDSEVDTLRHEEKEDIFTKLSKADSEKMSQSMAIVLNKRFEKEADSGDLTYLGIFFDGLSRRDVKDSKTYLAKLSAGAEDVIKGLEAQGKKEKPQWPGLGKSQAEYEQYFKQKADAQPKLQALGESAKRYGKLNDLYIYAFTMELGTHKEKYPIGKDSKNEDQFYETSPRKNIKLGSLKLNKEGEIVFKTQSYLNDNVLLSTKDINLQTYSNTTDFDIQSNKKILTDLEERKSNLWIEKSYGAVTSAVSAVNPEVGVLISVVENVIESQDDPTSAGLSAVNEVSGEFEGKFGKGTNMASGVAQNIYEYFTETEEINDKIKATKEEQDKDFFNVGGSTVTEDKIGASEGTVTDSRKANLNFDAFMRRDQLNTSGMAEIVYENELVRTQGDHRKAYEALNTFNTNLDNNDLLGETYTKEIRDYYKGTGAKTIDDIGVSKLHTVITDQANLINEGEKVPFPDGTTYLNDFPSHLRSTYDAYIRGDYNQYYTGGN